MIKFDENRPYQPIRKLHYIAEYYVKDHRNMSYDEIKEAMSALYNPIQENFINLGNIGIVRARRIEGTLAEFNSGEVLNPNPKHVLNYGRCNKPNESVFYGAFDVVTALKESNATIGDRFIIGLFTLKQRGMITSTVIGIPKNGISYQNEDMEVTSKIASNFFFNEFVKEVQKGEEYRYRQSCAFSENVFNRKSRDSIIYPSVKDYSRWNIAIKDTAVKERLIINGATEIEIIEVHPNHYKVKQLKVYMFKEDNNLIIHTPLNELEYHYSTYFNRDPNNILNDFLKDHIYLRKTTV